MNQLAINRHDRRRARTRAALLDAAESRFTQDGYGARIEAIAGEADVSVGSIYGHFGSKDGLWSALAERALERFAAYLGQAYRDEWPALDQVMACGHAYLLFHLDHPGSFRFLMFDGSQSRLPIDDPDGARRISDRLEAIIGGFQAKIEAAMKVGEARPGDARMTARFLWAAWNGMVALTDRGDQLALDEDELVGCIAQARQIVLEGLTNPVHRHADGSSRGVLRTVQRPPQETL